MKKRWQTLLLVTCIALPLLGVMAIIWNYGFGFGPDDSRSFNVKGPHGESWTVEEKEPGKDLWDWLGLFIIPAVLAGVGIAVSQIQKNTDIQLAKEQKSLELDLVKDQQEETNLQMYLDRMSDLLKEGLDDPAHSQQAKLQVVSRSRTLTILPRLKQDRIRSVIQFLYEAQLIVGDSPITSLEGANLSGANLTEANLTEANLVGTDLEEANLVGTNLRNANLEGAYLVRANLKKADLRGAWLESADLRGAWLEGADLRNAKLKKANLRNAKLERASLEGAYLERNNLSRADLRGAWLSGADLKHTNLEGAKVTSDQLKEAVLSNEIILPDASRFGEQEK